MGPDSDLIGELSEWRNISDVVRQSFKAMNEAMKLQGERIKQLEANLEDCVQVGELKQMQLSMSNKPTFAEVNRITGELMKEVNASSQWEDLRAQTQLKADKSEVRELYAGLTVANSKLNNRELELAVKDLKNQVNTLEQKLKKNEATNQVASGKAVSKAELEQELCAFVSKRDLEEQLGERVTIDQLDSTLDDFPTVAALDQVLAHKVDVDTMVQALKDHEMTKSVVIEEATKVAQLVRIDMLEQQERVQHELADMVESTVNDLQEVLSAKVSRGEFLEALALKVGLTDMDTRLKAATDGIAVDVKEAIERVQAQLVDVLNEKAFVSDVDKLLDAKASKNDIKRLASRKADIVDVRDALAIKVDSTKLEQALKEHSEVASANVSKAHAEIRDRIQELERKTNEVESGRAGKLDIENLSLEVKTKASIEDVCTLLDQKASVVDVNGALEDVNKVLREVEESTVTSHRNELDKMKRTLGHVASTVTSELALGRWIWKAGRVSSDRSVPWNVQSTNTCPENLIWTKDVCEITAVAPGLYEVTLGFFTDMDPAVQLLVNGEPAITATRDTHQHYSSNRLAGAPATHKVAGKTKVVRRGRHSAGNVTGWTLVDFVALPTRAQLSVLYDGDPSAQGFFGLRKL